MKHESFFGYNQFCFGKQEFSTVNIEKAQTRIERMKSLDFREIFRKVYQSHRIQVQCTDVFYSVKFVGQVIFFKQRKETQKISDVSGFVLFSSRLAEILVHFKDSMQQASLKYSSQKRIIKNDHSAE